jgi:hypothetical protein
MRACQMLIHDSRLILRAATTFLITTHLPSITVAIGKYRVSSMPLRLEDGRFGSGVSIRSGQGSASTDRVLRFIGQFDSEAAAHRHAHEQGALWVAQRSYGHTPLC